MLTHPDVELIKRVSAGDTGALAILLERYWASLVRYATGLLGSRDDAEDVAVETFERLWERRDAWWVEGTALPLLFRIGRNLSFDLLRRRSARQRVETSVQTPPAVVTPQAELEIDELVTLVAGAVDALPERRREVLMLVRMHGLSRKEVAELMDLAPQTVANHLQLALDDVRRALAPHLFELLGKKTGNTVDAYRTRIHSA